MDYSVHNFKQGHIIRSSDINEMDAQIAKNQKAIDDLVVAQAIRFDEKQETLSNEDRQRARTNIGAVGVEDHDTGICFVMPYYGDTNSNEANEGG